MMKSLLIAESQSTPKVDFDINTGKFILTGNSLPENAPLFYKPVFDWLKEIESNPISKIEFSFKLSYFNSASSKIIHEILIMLENFTKNGKDVIVNWHYMEIDEDMLESGKEYEDMFKLKFEFIKYE